MPPFAYFSKPAWSRHTMTVLTNIKRVAAILIMICFMLPLSRCNRNEIIDDPRTASAEANGRQEKRAPDPANEDRYAYQRISADNLDESAATLAAFFWPVIFLLLSLKTLKFRGAIAANLGELLLSAASAYMVFGITFFGDLRYGGYLAYFSIAAYFLATLAQIFLRIRARFRLRHA
jgi:hypothetical protein